MKKRFRPFILLIALAMISLTTLSIIWITTLPVDIQTRIVPPVNGMSFQEYLWNENSIVLIVQIGLMLAGALGVAALLPAPDEERNAE